MKYTVVGEMPIAIKNGDVQPGQTFDEEDLDPRTNVDALAAAGHIEPADDKPTKKPGESAK